ncbi:MAG TPA: helix-turn-helix transcriptional regulator [Chitinophagaceae bacterium]|jgi:predicted transcriptional regulator|nr:helix-turn-helix transcriptional regulator [Chitinophagaceae bacterium]
MPVLIERRIGIQTAFVASFPIITFMTEQIIDIIRKTIGKTIRTRREESMLSLRDLAAITDTSHSWLAKLEKGQINFQIDSLTKLIDCLQVQPKELFDFELLFNDE